MRYKNCLSQRNIQVYNKERKFPMFTQKEIQGLFMMLTNIEVMSLKEKAV